MALPANLATGDLINETWVDGVVDTITPTAWTAPTMQGAWVQFGAPYQTCQYRKVGDIVYIRGSIKNGVSGTVAFTLPVGFRPASPTLLPVLIAGAAAGGYCIIEVTGTVSPNAPSVTQVEFGATQFSTVA